MPSTSHYVGDASKRMTRERLDRAIVVLCHVHQDAWVACVSLKQQCLLLEVQKDDHRVCVSLKQQWLLLGVQCQRRLRGRDHGGIYV